MSYRSIRRALALASLGAISAAAIATVQGCATRQASTRGAPVAQAAPSAKPTPTGAPLGTHAPYTITAGLDGNLWFTEYQGDGIGRMTPYGATKRFPIDPDGFAERITAGPDGAVWFTDTVGNRIGRVAPDGKIAYINLPHSDSGPAGIASGPDGNIWFTEHSGNRIGRLSTTGTLTEIELPKGAGPAEIVTGSDGNLWFAEDKANRISRVTISGNVKEFAILTPDTRPAMMVLGADGNVWFTQPQANKIGRVTPGGYITEYALPAAGVPLGIAARRRQKSVDHRDSRAADLSHDPEGRFRVVPDAREVDGDVHHGGSRRLAVVHRTQRQGWPHHDLGNRDGIRLLESVQRTRLQVSAAPTALAAAMTRLFRSPSFAV